jgi:hypothetical protein
MLHPLLPLPLTTATARNFPVSAGKSHLFLYGGWDAVKYGERSDTPAPANREPDFLSKIKIWTQRVVQPNPGTWPSIFCQTISLPATP